MKKILCVLLALLLCVPAPVLAVDGDDFVGRDEEQKDALENMKPADKNTSGVYVSGGYLYLKKERNYSDSARVDYQMYTYSDITAADGQCLYVVHNPAFDGYYVQGFESFMYKYQWTSDQYNGSTQGPNLMTSGNCGNNLADMALERWVVAATNLPIFEIGDEAAIEEYINSGDMSGAGNKDELDYVEASPDDTIARPDVNIINTGDFSLTEGGTLTLGNVSVGWKTEQEGDYYDLAVRAYFYLYKDKLNIDWATLISGGAATIGGIAAKSMSGVGGGIATAVTAFSTSTSLLASGLGVWSPSVSVKSDSSGSSAYTFTTNAITKYINDYLTTQPNCSDYFISKFEVRVRHRIGSKYSRWRVVTIDYTKDGEASVTYENRDDKDVVYPDDTGSDSSSTEDSTVDVSGGSGGNITINIDNSNDNTNTNNNTNNNANDNSDIIDQVINGGGGDGSGGSDGSGWSISDLFGFIKGGFGLLGDSGLIPLLSAIFPFLPSEIFTILVTGVAAAVVIFIIKALKGLFS